jgi:hypothetical protein
MTPTATVSATAPCSPRPAPKIQVDNLGDGRLRVIVTAQSTAVPQTNTLQRLVFGAAQNARVEIAGAAPGALGGPATTAGVPNGTPGNFSLTLPAGAQRGTFVVERQQPGPFLVSYTVVDGCDSSSPFTTFVGGGRDVR